MNILFGRSYKLNCGFILGCSHSDLLQDCLHSNGCLLKGNLDLLQPGVFPTLHPSTVETERIVHMCDFHCASTVLSKADYPMDAYEHDRQSLSWKTVFIGSGSIYVVYVYKSGGHVYGKYKINQNPLIHLFYILFFIAYPLEDRSTYHKNIINQICPF